MRWLKYLAIVCFLCSLSNAQQVFELSCPAGSTPMPNGVTYNQTTDRYRAWLCVDSTGHVTVQGGGGGVSFPLLGPDGDCTTPTYSFTDHDGTGIATQPNAVLICVNGASQGVLDDSGVWHVTDIVADGNVTAASFDSASGNFSVPSNGIVTLTAITANSDGSCASNGSNAAPSVVSCPGAHVFTGLVSCSPIASLGTCEVQTDFVRGRDIIIIQPTASSAANTVLGVTCNTSLTLVPVIWISSITDGGGGSGKFTFNLPQFFTNPACFYFQIIGR